MPCSPSNYDLPSSGNSFTGIISDTHGYVAILGLLPFLLNLIFWRRTKNIDYLLLSIYFLYWSPQHLLRGFCDLKPFAINYMWNVIETLPLYIVAARAKWTNFKEMPNWVFYVAAIPITLGIISLIDQGNTFWYFSNGNLITGKVKDSSDPLALATLSLWWFLQWGRLILHSFIVYFYLSTKHYDNKRTIISRWIWIISSALWVFLNIFLIYMTVTTTFPPNAFLGINLNWWWLTPFFFSMLLLLINHTVFPDSVLISFTQIRRALSLYKQVPESNIPIVKISLNLIDQYLKQVAPLIDQAKEI